MKENLHTQLSMLRKERNLTLNELSLKARVGVEKLARYESGEEIPSKTNIIKALKCPRSTSFKFIGWNSKKHLMIK